MYVDEIENTLEGEVLGSISTQKMLYNLPHAEIHQFNPHRSLPEVQGLELGRERKESNIVLEEGQQTGIPTCQEYQVHKLR